jgi:transposase
MAKSSRMTEIEKGMIQAFKIEGKSNRWIADTMGRDESSIRYYLKNKENEKKKRGPKPKLSDTAKRLIIRNVSNKQISLAKLRSEMNLCVSKNTIRRVLKNAPNIKFKKMRTKPPLKKIHKQSRMDWAKSKMNWSDEWKRVIWSDEKKFNLDGPDGFAKYWHDLRKKELFFSKRHTGGGSVMIWACFNFQGKSTLAFVSGNQNQYEYQRHLNDHLLPFMHEFGGENPIFQQDNCRCHVARSTLQWLQDRNIQVMPWPAYSPDLNPIENLWGVLVRRIYEGGKQFNTIEELKTDIVRCWNEIEKNMLENLSNSMPKRVCKVIHAHGDSIEY